MSTIAERFRSRLSRSRTAGVGIDVSQKPEWATRCLNCGASLTSAFCADCGQRVVPPRPTMSELAGDAVAELSGWDGKFVATFRTLLRKPGELTRQFIDGRRVAFIAPVRLYLTVSLMYFLAAAAAPVLAPMELGVTAGSVNIGVTGKGSARPTPALAGAEAQAGMLTEADRKAALEDLEKAPPLMKPILQRTIDDPVGFRRNLFSTLPRVMFILVPLLGAIVGLFYRGRHYPEHLYFAIHTVSFGFLVMLVPELAKFTRVMPLSVALSLAAQLSLPIYVFLALRRVYGGTVGATIAKEIGIGLLYGAAYGVAVLCALYYAAVAA